MAIFPMIINGQKVTTQDTVGVINPATGEHFAQVPVGTAQHVDDAVAAAREAFPAWSALSHAERLSLIHI